MKKIQITISALSKILIVIYIVITVLFHVHAYFCAYNKFCGMSMLLPGLPWTLFATKIFSLSTSVSWYSVVFGGEAINAFIIIFIGNKISNFKGIIQIKK